MIEMRRGARHEVDYQVSAEDRSGDDLQLRIGNISNQGFMIVGEISLARGERISIRLPVIGRIEAHLVWAHEGRAGFQFERIIRPDDFQRLLRQLGEKFPGRKPR